MEAYIHKVQYYETDKMGITHHSNYIRWFEEARVEFLESVGWGYDKLEEMGIMSPVLGVECQYRESTTFADEIAINVSVAEFNGLKFTINYEMINLKNGHVVLTGTTRHCFLDKNMAPIRLKKEYPEFYDAMLALVKKD